MSAKTIADLPGVLFVDQPFLATTVTVWVDFAPTESERLAVFAQRAAPLLPRGYDRIDLRFRRR